jgi:hypothetical protein
MTMGLVCRRFLDGSDLREIDFNPTPIPTREQPGGTVYTGASPDRRRAVGGTRPAPGRHCFGCATHIRIFESENPPEEDDVSAV